MAINKKYIDLGTDPDDVNATALLAIHAPANYTPTQVAAEGTDKISAHLKGIDAVLSGAVPETTAYANVQGTAPTTAKSDHVHRVLLTDFQYHDQTTLTTTSTDFVTMTGMTFTPGAGKYIARASFNQKNSNMSGTVAAAIFVGGVVDTDSERTAFTNTVVPGFRGVLAVENIYTIADGQTIDVRWKVSGNTGSAFNKSFILVRIG